MAFEKLDRSKGPSGGSQGLSAVDGQTIGKDTVEKGDQRLKLAGALVSIAQTGLAKPMDGHIRSVA
jgi:hypothetical protein